jgi:hypothetical protein
MLIVHETKIPTRDLGHASVVLGTDEDENVSVQQPRSSTTTLPFVIPPAPACRGGVAKGSAVRPPHSCKPRYATLTWYCSPNLKEPRTLEKAIYQTLMS